MGILFGFNICVNDIKIENETSFFNKFITTFIFNYWLIFIIWLLGKNKHLYILVCFLVFLKIFIFGIIFIVNIKVDNLIGYLKYFALDLLIYYPLLIYLLQVNFNFHYTRKNKINYDTILIISTICCLIYSAICGFIGSSL